jgi:NAD-reducing hydrogenase large subunit
MVTSISSRKIVIEPITRVEGHGKVTIRLDEDGRVQDARFHVVEFRGFERFIQGRPYWEVPVLVQRLCGICPVSHHLAAAKAMDWIVGGEKLTPTAEKMRRLMHHGQIFQSHALHFFHLSSPDLLFGFNAPVEKRNVIGVIREYPELATHGVLMRKFGQEIIKATAGKKIHGTGAIPGGINKNLSTAERDTFLKDIDQVLHWSLDALSVLKNIHLEGGAGLKSFAAYPSSYLSLVRKDGAMDLYDGVLRAKNADGDIIFDGVDVFDYAKYIGEYVVPWSYMKFPFIRSLGKENGWYRVGPLARLNNCDFIPTPLAEAARKEFMKQADGGRMVHSTMLYHWARLIETIHAAETIKELLADPDLQGDNLTVSGSRRSEGVGVIEAPRGTLFHHYRVNAQDLVEMANLIVSTTSNNEPMNRAVREVAMKHLDGKTITEGLLNHIEVAIRAFDPCLSCATHALGTMNLEVELVDASGAVIYYLRK